MTFSLMKRAEAELVKAENLSIPDGRKNGFKKHPAAAVYKSFSEQFRKCCSDFGLNPTSRGRIDAGSLAGDDDGDNLAEEMLGYDEPIPYSVIH